MKKEILPLRKQVLWGGTKEEKEAIRPYLESLEAELKKLEEKAAFWEKMLASASISRSRKTTYKDATSVIHSRKMLNKVAVHLQQLFGFPYERQGTPGWKPGYGDVLAARRAGYVDSKGSAVKDFFDDADWLELDVLNRDVNGEAHDDSIPTDPASSSAIYRVVVPDNHFYPEIFRRVLLRCGVGRTEGDIEIQKASNDSSGSERGSPY